MSGNFWLCGIYIYDVYHWDKADPFKTWNKENRKILSIISLLKVCIFNLGLKQFFVHVKKYAPGRSPIL